MAASKTPDDIARKFLDELEATLDLREAAETLALSESEVRALLTNIKDALPGDIGRSVKQGKAPGPGRAAAQKPDQKPDKTKELVIYVDGASRGNPGRAGAGAVIKDAKGNIVKLLTRDLGSATNNVAEYEALILALEEALILAPGSGVSVFADSELVVKQIRGEYKVKNETLKGLHAIAAKLTSAFPSFKITHIPREKNKEADKLANQAIDGV